MKKIYISIILLIIFLIVFTTFFYYFTMKKQSSPASNLSANYQAQQSNTSDDKIVIKTSQGDLMVNNIEKNPVQKIAFDGSVLFKESSDYQMSFYPPDQGFILTLMSPDISVARSSAEKDFLDTLGITKEQSCLLKVTLNVPYDIKMEASGKNYGLSFCPNGKSLPTN